MPIEGPKLDDLRFDLIVQEMIRSIPVYAPEWTDHNESDPGITMIQLFAQIAEQVGYRLNRIPEKNHVELLKLLGVRLAPARAATTRLAYVLSNPPLLTGFTLTAGARAKPKAGDPPPTFETDQDIDIVPAEPVAIVTTRGPKLWDLLDGVPGPLDTSANHYLRVVWDGKSPKLAEMPIAPVPLLVQPGHEYVWIALDFNPSRDAGFRGVRATLTLQWDDDEQPDPATPIFCEAAHPTGEPAPPPIDWLGFVDGDRSIVEQVSGRIDDTTKRLSRSGTIRFAVPLELSAVPSTAWIDLRPEVTGTSLDACVSLAHGLRGSLSSTGTIELSHFQTALSGIIHPATPAEPLHHPLPARLRTAKGWLRLRLPCPIPDSWSSPKLRMLTFNAASATNARTETAVVLGIADGRPGQAFQLPHRNILAASLTLAIQEDPAPGANLVTWHPVDSLDGAGPFDRVYVLDAEAGTITFGDGRRGRIPPLVPRGGNVVALGYRHGGGKPGEVAVGAVSVMESARAGLANVVNFVAATGGQDAETLDAAKLRARKDLSTRSRAVTADDFAWLAKQTPSVRIGRAAVVPLRRPLRGSKPSEPDDPICGGMPPRRPQRGGCEPPIATPTFEAPTTAGAPCPLPGSPPTNLPLPRCGPPLPAGDSGLALDDVPGVVTVVVIEDVPGNEPSARPSTLRKVCEYLDRHRLVTTELHVVAPQYMRLCNFMVEVSAQPGYTRARVQELVEARLGTYLHSLTGGDDGKGFPFAGEIHVADLLAQVLRTEGVSRVIDLSAEFSRTKSNVSPREGRIVLCPQAAGEYDRIELAKEETASIYLDTFTLSTVV